MPAQGKIVQIMGPVLDVQFPPDQLPDIYNAIHIPLTAAAEDVNAQHETGAARPERIVVEV
jgi:F-type H+/Na+-transporting ATPase subunit beta